MSEHFRIHAVHLAELKTSTHTLNRCMTLGLDFLAGPVHITIIPVLDDFRPDGKIYKGAEQQFSLNWQQNRRRLASMGSCSRPLPFGSRAAAGNSSKFSHRGLQLAAY